MPLSSEEKLESIANALNMDKGIIVQADYSEKSLQSIFDRAQRAALTTRLIAYPAVTMVIGGLAMKFMDLFPSSDVPFWSAIAGIVLATGADSSVTKLQEEVSTRAEGNHIAVVNERRRAKIERWELKHGL